MQRGDRAEAVTIISPIHRWWSPWLRVTWPISDPVWLLKRDLVRLGFIHIAHWSLIARMPPRPRLRGKRLPHPFVIFQSNFNDDLNAYIDPFALVVPWRIRGVWQGVYHFPGPAPVDRFIGFILDRVIPTSYYYRAFPDASSTMIRAALSLERRHRRFKRHPGRPD